MQRNSKMFMLPQRPYVPLGNITPRHHLSARRRAGEARGTSPRRWKPSGSAILKDRMDEESPWEQTPLRRRESSGWPSHACSFTVRT